MLPPPLSLIPLTVTAQLADWLPQVAVTVAWPFATAVTSPLLTVTIPWGFTLHTTGWVQFSGVTVAVNWYEPTTLFVYFLTTVTSDKSVKLKDILI